ncbi:MAG: response regulator transcription factor [Verrucomicrobiota bacterium]
MKQRIGTKVLVIGEDAEVRGRMTETLSAAGFEVDALAEVTGGLYRASEQAYDVIVFDFIVPEIIGSEMLHGLREQSVGTPILMSLALGELDERIDGLEDQADDFITKPYNEREFLTRIRTLARRTPRFLGDRLQIGRVTIKLLESRIELDGEPVELTASQFRIVSFLARRSNRIVSRADLADAIYGCDEERLSNVLEVQIYHIRRKLGKDFVVSRRGLGYTIPNG